MKTLLCSVAFLIAIGFARSSNPECPKTMNGTSSLCVCYIIAGQTIVSCSFISSPESLLKEVKSLQGHEIGDFKLVSAKLPYLPAGLFAGTIVKRFHIMASHLDNLYDTKNASPSPFQGLENSLEEIHVVLTNSLDKWYWPDMKDFKQLKKIDLEHSTMSFIGHNFAEIGEGSLEVFTASHTRTYRLHPQGFTEMKNLREANFNENFIPYLVRTMFPNPAPRLERLNFRDNKIFTLNENMFENMPALKFLDLSYNEFKSFQETPFNPIWNTLEFLGLQANPFQCECNLITLKERFLAGSVPPKNDFNSVACIYKGSYKKTALIDVNRNDPAQCLW